MWLLFEQVRWFNQAVPLVYLSYEDSINGESEYA